MVRQSRIKVLYVRPVCLAYGLARYCVGMANNLVIDSVDLILCEVEAGYAGPFVFPHHRQTGMPPASRRGRTFASPLASMTCDISYATSSDQHSCVQSISKNINLLSAFVPGSHRCLGYLQACPESLANLLPRK